MPKKNSRLKPEQVRELKRLLYLKYDRHYLARKYNMTKPRVDDVARGTLYRKYEWPDGSTGGLKEVDEELVEISRISLPSLHFMDGTKYGKTKCKDNTEINTSPSGEH